MEHPWERIYREEGRFFDEPFPRFGEVVQQFKDGGCDAVLDLGCGSGRHTVGLAKAGFEVTGLDISPMGLGLTRSWLDKMDLAASLVRADFRDLLPFRDGSFAAVFSTQVIHHALLAEVQATIGEMWRVLAPGGLAFVSVVGRLHHDTEYEEIEPGTYLPLTGWEAGLPHHIFDRATFAEALAGFRVILIERRDGGRVVVALVQKV